MAVWIVRDYCGIACVVLSWVLMAFGNYALLGIVLLPKLRETLASQQTSTLYDSESLKLYAHIIIFEFFTILAIFSHLRTIFTDPGSIPRNTSRPELMTEITPNGLPTHVVYQCPECCSSKPDRAHHCSVCERCVMKMDHHCPFVNNCVGERNQKYFMLFTLFVAIIASHGLYLSLGHFLECLRNRKYQVD